MARIGGTCYFKIDGQQLSLTGGIEVPMNKTVNDDVCKFLIQFNAIAFIHCPTKCRHGILHVHAFRSGDRGGEADRIAFLFHPRDHHGADRRRFGDGGSRDTSE